MSAPEIGFQMPFRSGAVRLFVPLDIPDADMMMDIMTEQVQTIDESTEAGRIKKNTLALQYQMLESTLMHLCTG